LLEITARAFDPGKVNHDHPADPGCADPIAELEQLALDPLVPQPWSSAARRSMSAAISVLAGGRPVRFG
jgi:hypothetical protein